VESGRILRIDDAVIESEGARNPEHLDRMTRAERAAGVPAAHSSFAVGGA
jgi:hypothetical protein